jgi:hypothetical protein
VRNSLARSGFQRFPTPSATIARFGALGAAWRCHPDGRSRSATNAARSALAATGRAVGNFVDVAL